MPRKATQPKTVATKPATDVAGYLASLDGERKTSLSRLRSIILQTVPGADEMIKSGMPYYEYHGMLCAFASQKHYLSFYILNGEVVNKHRHLLKGLDVGKGCIRLKSLSKVEEETLRQLLRAAAAANEAAFNDHC